MHRFLTLCCIVAAITHFSARSQNLPADFPPLPVTITGQTSPGVFLFAPNTRILTTAYGYYVIVLDSAGVPFKWHKMPEPAFDCKVTQTGQMGYSVYRPQSVTIGQSTVYLLDTSMVIVDSIQMKNGYLTSQHGFDVLPNGNKLVYDWEEVTMDMSKIAAGGNPAAVVLQGLLQEQDQDGNVVYQWRSLDNIPWDATTAKLTDAYIRSVHNNGLDVDTDGNYLLSMRTLSAILKVDRNNGDILWYLGGKKNQFTYLNDAGTNGDWSFRSQHDPRRAHNGHLTLFDNGSAKPQEYSRGVEYDLDETNMTASVVWEHRQSPDVFANQQGSVQALRDGHHVVAWGTVSFDEKPSITEVDAENNVVFSLNVPKEFAVYKAEKHAWPIGSASREVTCENLDIGDSCNLVRANGDLIAHFYIEQVGTPVITITIRAYPFGPRNARFDTKAPWIYKSRIVIDKHGHSIRGKLLVQAAEFGLPTTNMSEVRCWGRPTIGSGTFMEVILTHSSQLQVYGITTGEMQEFIFGIPPRAYTPKKPVLAFPRSGGTWNNEDTLELRAFPQGRGDLNELEYGLVGSTSSIGGGSTRGERVKVGILADGEYWWRARAMWDGTVGEWSDTVHFTVGAPYITATAPTSEVTWPRDSSVTIRWNTNVSGPVKLVLMKGITEVLTIAASASGATGAYVWKVPLTAPVDSGYSIQLQTLNKQTVMAVGPDVINIASGTTSVSSTDEAASLHLSPNPSSDLMRLKSDNMLVHRIVIYSQLGAHISTV